MINELKDFMIFAAAILAGAALVAAGWQYRTGRLDRAAFGDQVILIGAIVSLLLMNLEVAQQVLGWLPPTVPLFVFLWLLYRKLKSAPVPEANQHTRPE